MINYMVVEYAMETVDHKGDLKCSLASRRIISDDKTSLIIET